MSRKTHPIGFRLGVTQHGTTQLQCYGKTSYTTYSYLTLKLLKLSELLERISSKTKVCLSNYEWTIKENKLSSNITYCSFENSERSKEGTRTNWISKNSFEKDSRLIQLAPRNIMSTWMKNLIRIRFYNVHWLHDPKTLAFWIANHLLQRQSVKNIFKLLKRELQQRKSWEHKTKVFISGNTKFSLSGIKIICCGRLRGKRQKMSSNISKQLGVMPLQTLNMFIEYEKIGLCTRFGKVGIHVYYHYSRTEHE